MIDSLDDGETRGERISRIRQMKGRPTFRRAVWAVALAVCVLLALAVMRGWPGWTTVLIAVPLVSAVIYLRLRYSPPSEGPGLLADFVDDVRRRPRRSDSWRAK